MTTTEPTYRSTPELLEAFVFDPHARQEIAGRIRELEDYGTRLTYRLRAAVEETNVVERQLERARRDRNGMVLAFVALALFLVALVRLHQC